MLPSVDRTFQNALEHRPKFYSIRRLVTLGRTSAQGGAYFAAFFDWMGEAREGLLSQTSLFGQASLHTSEAHMKYLRELRPFDTVEVVVWPRANRFSVSLRFFFIRGEELIGVGDQQICLKTPDGALLEIGEALRGAISRYDPDSLF